MKIFFYIKFSRLEIIIVQRNFDYSINVINISFLGKTVLIIIVIVKMYAQSRV